MKKIILSNFCAHRSPTADGVYREADQELTVSSQDATVGLLETATESNEVAIGLQEAVNASQEAANAPHEMTNASQEMTNASQEVASTAQEPSKPAFQPPLPIGPPPPDSPTRIQIKKEILDDEYQDNSDLKEKIPIFDVKCKQEVTPIDPNQMCPQFSRGLCSNGSACEFKHEIDLAELRSKPILKFCWDYQNKGCTRSFCKHVHATIFEEQHYYRTGYLRPSAITHQKQENVSQNKGSSSANVQAPISPVTTGKRKASSPIYQESQPETPKVTSLWDQYNGVSSGPPDFISRDPTTKKCKNCDIKQYSEEMSNNKLQEVLRSIVRLKEDTAEVTKKSKRLFHIIESVMTLNAAFPERDTDSLLAELMGVAKHNATLSPESFH